MAGVPAEVAALHVDSTRLRTYVEDNIPAADPGRQSRRTWRAYASLAWLNVATLINWAFPAVAAGDSDAAEVAQACKDVRLDKKGRQRMQSTAPKLKKWAGDTNVRDVLGWIAENFTFTLSGSGLTWSPATLMTTLRQRAMAIGVMYTWALGKDMRATYGGQLGNVPNNFRLGQVLFKVPAHVFDGINIVLGVLVIGPCAKTVLHALVLFYLMTHALMLLDEGDRRVAAFRPGGASEPGVSKAKLPPAPANGYKVDALPNTKAGVLAWVAVQYAYERSTHELTACRTDLASDLDLHLEAYRKMLGKMLSARGAAAGRLEKISAKGPVRRNVPLTGGRSHTLGTRLFTFATDERVRGIVVAERDRLQKLHASFKNVE